MSEEIKEILFKVKKENKYENILWDYITNLQKENTDLKKLCDKYEEEHKTTFETWKKVIVRNEKAIECIKNIDYFEGEISDDIENIPFKYVMDTDIDELLNILQGGDE